MSEPLLQAVNLQCERDDRILFRDLSVSILPGTLTRVEGPNGSGKTTLLRILAGLNDSYSGDLLWRGRPRHTYREEFLRNMLYLGHRPGIKPLLTPMENLRALMAGRRRVADKVLWQAWKALASVVSRTYPVVICPPDSSVGWRSPGYWLRMNPCGSWMRYLPPLTFMVWRPWNDCWRSGSQAVARSW